MPEPQPLRCLVATALSLTTCLLVLGTTTAPADARIRHPRPAAARVKAKTVAPAATTGLPNLGLNADDTLRAPVIEDAPTDDYERVAWCHGVLSGDMDLAEQIDSVMPVDTTLRTIGQSYLRAYEAALTLSGKGNTEAGHQRAETARLLGYDGWKGARAASVDKAAGAYATWQLPGDCEHAAVRLSGHPNLFAEMATDDEVNAITEVMNSGGAHDYKELPKPVLTAQTAATVPADAPIATNTLGKRANQARSLPALPPQTGASQPATVQTTQDKP